MDLGFVGQLLGKAQSVSGMVAGIAGIVTTVSTVAITGWTYKTKIDDSEKQIVALEKRLMDAVQQNARATTLPPVQVTREPETAPAPAPAVTAQIAELQQRLAAAEARARVAEATPAPAPIALAAPTPAAALPAALPAAAPAAPAVAVAAVEAAPVAAPCATLPMPAREFKTVLRTGAQFCNPAGAVVANVVAVDPNAVEFRLQLNSAHDGTVRCDLKRACNVRWNDRYVMRFTGVESASAGAMQVNATFIPL